MFIGSSRVQLDLEAQDRLSFTKEVKVWLELTFTGPGKERGGLRSGGRGGSVTRDRLEGSIPLG